jgi:hypothetical protein
MPTLHSPVQAAEATQRLQPKSLLLPYRPNSAGPLALLGMTKHRRVTKLRISAVMTGWDQESQFWRSIITEERGLTKCDNISKHSKDQQRRVCDAKVSRGRMHHSFSIGAPPDCLQVEVIEFPRFARDGKTPECDETSNIQLYRGIILTGRINSYTLLPLALPPLGSLFSK